MGKLLVVDYAYQHPSVEQLKSAGVDVVGRYFSQTGSTEPHNLDRAEALQLNANGIKIVSLFEYGAAQALGGAAQAMRDVEAFRAQAEQIDPPDGAVIRHEPCYFAADFDIPDYAPQLTNIPENAEAKLGPLADYWKVIRSERGLGVSAAYGGYWLISRLFNANLISFGFQTTAWSGGQVDRRAQLYQNGATDFGGSADVDLAKATRFGAWSL
jgi:hypothetical protein